MYNKILVTGAGGFIGNALVTYLKNKGYWVRGVDLKCPNFSQTKADQFWIKDLRDMQSCVLSASGIDKIYHLAADMGGIGYISFNKADIFKNNSLIDINMLESAKICGIKDFLYSSSACIYPQNLQRSSHALLLKEEDAFPADAEPGYGWEKLFMELASTYYRGDYGIRTRIVRFHNIFGPLSEYKGGREKAPAAICRKIAEAKNEDIIEVWGDGKQTRSFCYVEDCVEGIYRLMNSNYFEPINLGHDRLVSINDLVDIIANIANKKIKKKYNNKGPQGVRGRNSDNTKIKRILNWSPKVSLEVGLEKTYKWVLEQTFAHNASIS